MATVAEVHEKGVAKKPHHATVI